MNFNAKGADFEREQAKTLSLWISSGTDSDLLWRSSQSGGRATAGKVKGAQYGDLWYQKPHPEAKAFLELFCIELKRYKSLDLLKAWLNVGNEFNKWWEQNKRDADKHHVNPLLIMKPNGMPTLMCFEYKLVKNIPTLSDDSRIVMCTDNAGDGYRNIAIYKQDALIQQTTWEDFKGNLNLENTV